MRDVAEALHAVAATTGADGIFNVGSGRYSRIFVASAPGWHAAEGETPSVEDIRDNLEAIRSTEEFKIPANAAEA